MSVFLNLLTVLVCIKVVFSIVGLLSIWLTARFVKQWSKDVEHKVLLNLTLVLAINEIFGFANIYSTPEVFSASCIFIGMLRHYSYLSMYIWILLLALIELRSYVRGDSLKLSTSVSCILGYGLPIIPVAILTIINPNLYTSEIYDRGFCYPERISFWISIQLPAGIILLSMVIILVTMLFHSCKCLYEFLGNEEKRKIATKRLVTVLMIGLGWGLYFFVDARLIKNDFLFDNLFLILCSANVFKLSFVFVLTDYETREGWRNRRESKMSEVRANIIREIELENELSQSKSYREIDTEHEMSQIKN